MKCIICFITYFLMFSACAEDISQEERKFLKGNILDEKPALREVKNAKSSTTFFYMNGRFSGCLYVLSDNGKCSEVSFLLNTKGKEKRFDIGVKNSSFTMKSSGGEELTGFYSSISKKDSAFIKLGEKVLMNFFRFDNKNRVIGNSYWIENNRFEFLGPILLIRMEK